MFTEITIKVPMVPGAAVAPDVRAVELGEIPAPPSVGELEGMAEGAEVLPPPEESVEIAQYEVPAPPSLEELEEPAEGEVLAPPSFDESEEELQIGEPLLPPPEELDEMAQYEVPAPPSLDELEGLSEEEVPSPPPLDDKSEEKTGNQVTTPRIKRPKKDTDA